MDTQGASSESLDQLEARWRASRSPQAALRLAERLFGEGRGREAETVLAELQPALAADPLNLSARVALGRLRLATGQAPAAARALEEVVERDPTHLLANKVLVQVYMELGERGKARDRLDLYRLLNAGDPEIDSLEGLVVGDVAAVVAPEVRPAPRRRRVVIATGDPFTGLAAPPATAVPAGAVFALPTALTAPPPPAASAATSPPAAAAPPAATSPPGLEPATGSLPAVEVPAATVAEAEVELPEIAPAEVVPAEIDFSDMPPEPAPEPATATLGELYRRQGHTAEAEGIFRRVLEREPGNAAARRGLESLAAPPAGTLTAAELLGGLGELPAEPLQRKMLVLQQYRERLRG